MTEFKERWERMSTIEKIAHLRADWDSCGRSDPLVAMVAAAVAHSVLREAGEEITRLRAERDEARRMVCSHEADLMEDMIEHAKHRGWDCFKEGRT
jgi:hypothetical protein